MNLAAALACAVSLWCCACTAHRSNLFPEDMGGGGGFGKNSAEARITHLLTEGQFAEAEALIAETRAAGLIEQSTADTLRKSIAEQSMKLGDIPATLQRVASFPANLRDYTRFRLQRMLELKDFSVATKKELQTALKLLKEQKRLLEQN